MGKELVTVDQEGLELIRTRFNRREEDFAKELQFAELILDGESRTQAYATVYKVDKDTAKKVAGNKFRTRTVQELLRHMRPNDDTLYIGELQTIIKKGMSIIRDGRSSNRDVLEAMKALNPYLKAQQQLEVKHEMEVTIKPADAVMTRMQQQIELLTASGKMIDQSGEIIDVEEVI